MIGKVEPIQIESGEWIFIKGIPFANLSEYLAYESVWIGQEGEISRAIVDKILSMIVVFPPDLTHEALTKNDLQLVLECLAKLNTPTPLPSLSSNELNVEIPSTNNYFIDTAGVLFKTFSPIDAMSLMASETLDVINAILWRINALDRYSEWEEKAQQKEDLTRLNKIVDRLDTPEAKEWLSQQLKKQ